MSRTPPQSKNPDPDRKLTDPGQSGSGLRDHSLLFQIDRR